MDYDGDETAMLLTEVQNEFTNARESLPKLSDSTAVKVAFEDLDKAFRQRGTEVISTVTTITTTQAGQMADLRARVKSNKEKILSIKNVLPHLKASYANSHGQQTQPADTTGTQPLPATGTQTQPANTTGTQPLPATGTQTQPANTTGTQTQPADTTGTQPLPATGIQTQPANTTGTQTQPATGTQSQPADTTGTQPQPATGTQPQPATGTQPQPANSHGQQTQPGDTTRNQPQLGNTTEGTPSTPIVTQMQASTPRRSARNQQIPENPPQQSGGSSVRSRGRGKGGRGGH
ncbi:hypothetical protein YC2023_017597 [Brassica napus]